MQDKVSSTKKHSWKSGGKSTSFCHTIHNMAYMNWGLYSQRDITVKIDQKQN